MANRSFRRSGARRNFRRFRSGKRNLAWVGVHFDYEVDGTAVSNVALIEPELLMDGQVVNKVVTVRRIIGEFICRAGLPLDNAQSFDKHDYHGIVVADEELQTGQLGPDPGDSTDLTEERWWWNGMTYWAQSTVGTGETGGGFSSTYNSDITRLDFKPNKRVTSDEELLFCSTGHPTIDANILSFVVAWWRVLIEY